MASVEVLAHEVLCFGFSFPETLSHPYPDRDSRRVSQAITFPITCFTACASPLGRRPQANPSDYKTVKAMDSPGVLRDGYKRGEMEIRRKAVLRTTCNWCLESAFSSSAATGSYATAALVRTRHVSISKYKDFGRRGQGQEGSYCRGKSLDAKRTANGLSRNRPEEGRPDSSSSAEKAVNELLASTAELYLVLAQFAISADTNVMHTFSLVLLRRLLFGYARTRRAWSVRFTGWDVCFCVWLRIYLITRVVFLGVCVFIVSPPRSRPPLNPLQPPLHSLCEPSPTVRRKAVDTVADVANERIPNGTTQVQVPPPLLRISTYEPFPLSPMIISDLPPHAVVSLLLKGWRDESIEVRNAAVKARVGYLQGQGQVADSHLEANGSNKGDVGRSHKRGLLEGVVALAKVLDTRGGVGTPHCICIFFVVGITTPTFLSCFRTWIRFNAFFVSLSVSSATSTQTQIHTPIKTLHLHLTHLTLVTSSHPSLFLRMGCWVVPPSVEGVWGEKGGLRLGLGWVWVGEWEWEQASSCSVSRMMAMAMALSLGVGVGTLDGNGNGWG
ncbi:hypothetical protein D9758_015738 [Tetrapyrgos nigripes]|uniref:Uncharacterized protein n=1 Tax=Tetrapyrgos nigripes TaxID=182062 RepID=A0A8H5FRD0_9AGAR|nr:hypothetical protein D9758_015738 [Tetrapyrgos nigripes]